MDFQIPVHKVGDNLLNTVTDLHCSRLYNQNQTFTRRNLSTDETRSEETTGFHGPGLL